MNPMLMFLKRHNALADCIVYTHLKASTDGFEEKGARDTTRDTPH